MAPPLESHSPGDRQHYDHCAALRGGSNSGAGVRGPVWTELRALDRLYANASYTFQNFKLTSSHSTPVCRMTTFNPHCADVVSAPLSWEEACIEVAAFVVSLAIWGSYLRTWYRATTDTPLKTARGAMQAARRSWVRNNLNAGMVRTASLELSYSPHVYRLQSGPHTPAPPTARSRDVL